MKKSYASLLIWIQWEELWQLWSTSRFVSDNFKQMHRQCWDATNHQQPDQRVKVRKSHMSQCLVWGIWRYRWQIDGWLSRILDTTQAAPRKGFDLSVCTCSSRSYLLQKVKTTSCDILGMWKTAKIGSKRPEGMKTRMQDKGNKAVRKESSLLLARRSLWIISCQFHSSRIGSLSSD